MLYKHRSFVEVQLPRAADELGVMFYTYVGVMQRDAQPWSVSLDDSNVGAARLPTSTVPESRAREYAKDIGRAKKEIPFRECELVECEDRAIAS